MLKAANRLQAPVPVNAAQRLHRTPDGRSSRALTEPGYPGNQTLLRQLSHSGPMVRRDPPADAKKAAPPAPASPTGPAPSPAPDAAKTDEVKLTIPWDEILKGNTTLMQVLTPGLQPPAPAAGGAAPVPIPATGGPVPPKAPAAGSAPPAAPVAPLPAPAGPTPDAPSRLALKDFGSLSMGLRLGFPDLKTDPDPNAPPSGLQQAIQTGEIINYDMTGKLPTAYQIDKGKLVGACWGLFSKYVAPDFAAKIAKGMSGKSAGGGISYELDGVLLPDFSGGGVSFTLKFGGSSKKRAPASPATGPVQPKLKVGSTTDPLEAEADRAADHVMRLPDSAVAGTLQRKCAACEDEDAKAHTKNNGLAEAEGNAPPIVSQALSSPGQALDTRTRSFFEKRFDTDFSQVRIHKDSLAAQSADAVNARAYATGNHIVLGAGESASPSRLLAHELAHVVQQQGATPAAVRRGPQDMPEPNKAPACEDVCGEGDKCTQEAGEHCSDDQNKAVCGSKSPGVCSGGSMKKAVDNLTQAINVMYNKADSPVVATSLQDNFGWKQGSTPADLPTQVTTNLEAALARMGAHQLCIKCVTCGGKTVSAVYQARGANCTDQNCFALCETFFANAKIQPHALIHEFHHLVLPPGPRDLYRGDSGYPDVPPMMLKMPDAYASLVDDLQTVTLPPAPKP